MPLDKAGLESTLAGILGQENSPAEAAAAIAGAIDTFVKTATVSTSVAVVSVSGVTAGAVVSGPGTGTGTGTLS